MKKFLSFIVIMFILLPMFTSVADAATVREVKKTHVTTQLRVSASPKASVISSLPKGSLVTQLNTVKGGWSYVQASNKKGYVATSALSVPSSKIKIVDHKNGLEIKETVSAKSKTMATLKQKMVVADFGSVGNGWSLVQYGNVTGYVNSKMITASKPTKKYTNANVTLRNTASASGKKTGSLNKNKEVSVHSQISSWSYVTSGSLRGYVPSSQLTTKKPAATAQTLKTFNELRPTKIKWMKYYFDGTLLQDNLQKYSNNENEYYYTVPSVYTSFTPKHFEMGYPESDFIYAEIRTPLVQNKPTPFYEVDWKKMDYVKSGNSYLRTKNGTITTPAGTFKNVVHIEQKYYDLSYTVHFYFAPGYGLIKVIDSKKRLFFELRSFK